MTPVSAADIADADIFLSIVPPGDAPALAEKFAPLLAGKRCLYVDCNAVSPQTKAEIGATIARAGVRFVDVGIIGGPPQPDGDGPAFYTSGEHAPRLTALQAYGLDVRVIDGPIGAAAALKMSYAGITKGVTAIGAAMLLAATRAGAAEALRQELAASQPALLAWLTRQMPGMPGKAFRGVAEMEEIAAFAGADAAATQMYHAAARLYARLAEDGVTTKEEIEALSRFIATR
jgi:putative dehydrogenase